MPSYSYRARQRTGEIVEGTIQADDEKAVVVHLQKQGLLVSNIKRGSSDGLSLSTNIFQRKTISLKELAIFCQQFSTLLDAGSSMIASLDVLNRQTTNPYFKTVITQITQNVQKGMSFSASLKEYRKVFPNVMISMVEAGELGGILDKSLARLALQFEKEYKLREKVKSAMIYPSILVVFAITVVVFIMVFVMPTFIELFKNMNVELPTVTKMLITISDTLINHYIIIISIIAAIIFGLSILWQNMAFRYLFSRIILELPVIGSLSAKVSISRFSRTFASLIRSGVSFIPALDIVKDTSDNLVFARALDAVKREISLGNTLASSMSRNPIFPPLLVQLVLVGEESGSLDQMLDKITDFYDSEVDEVINRLNALVDPIMISFLGVIIGFVVLAVLLPVFDIVTNVK